MNDEKTITVKDCQHCPHNQFGTFGKYGQEHYCDIDDHDITTEVIYGKCYSCPLDKNK